jgi:uncharacterized phage protein (TIGR02218 family)
VYHATSPAYLASITPESERLLFRGEVFGARRKGLEWSFQARSLLGRKTRVPGFMVQTRCQYPLFEAATCKASASAFQIDGSLAAISGVTVDFSSAGLSGRAGDWLAGGRLAAGPETRTIAQASQLSAGVHRLTLVYPLQGAAAGDSASAWPGCDRTPGTCAAKFANLDNFGGFPFVPTDNPGVKAMPLDTSSTAGGKK